MNETESALDEVDSLVSLSESTIYSNLNDALSIADSQDIDDETGAIVQEHETAAKHEQHQNDDEHDKQDEQNGNSEEDQLPTTTKNQKNTKNTKKETILPRTKDSSLRSSNNEVKDTTSESINEASGTTGEEDLMKTNGKAPEENAGSDEENSEWDREAEEFPFLRSVKYLEKHEIFRLFQNLAADIVYQRPDNPLQFIVNKLEKEKEESERNQEDTNTANQVSS